VVAVGGGGNATVHLALVENEVHNTGENCLRFHVMVVRSLATAPAGATNFEHTFDLEAISAANLRYYDEYAAELKARLGLRGVEDCNVTFKELRNTMDPRNLSLIAFAQDEQTKEILQSAYVKVQ
jgi:hypothetical protein